MALKALCQLLREARAGGYAVGYFEAWDCYSFEAVVQAAEAERSPVVLGFGGMMMDQAWLDRFGIEPWGAYGHAVARRTAAPAALMLNEVWELDHAARGIQSGFNAVMLNTSELPFERNVELTRQLVELAHPRGVEVQAELGRLPTYNEEGAGMLTDPEQAREFVEQTGVDCLAVSIGNVHLRTEGKSIVDLQRLREIRNRVDLPLVIHGGSGYPEHLLGEAIGSGVNLFHVGSILKRRFIEAVRESIGAMSAPLDFQARVGSRKAADFLLPGCEAVCETVRAAMRLYGSSGRAV